MRFSMFQELKKPKNMTMVSMLTAVGVVLSAYAVIRVSPEFQVSFGYLASGIIAMLFGPAVNAISGLVTDLVSHFLFVDGPYFIWFALNPMVSGVIFALFFYRKKVTLPKAILAKLLDTLVVEIGMTSVWLIMLYGSKGWLWFALRAGWKLVAFLVQAPVLYLVLKAVNKAKEKL